MSAILEAVRDKPVALFQMDDSAPFQDYSGYGVVGVMDTGVSGTSTALVSGATSSSVFDILNVGKFPSSVFKQGQEDKPFSLEAWVYLQNKGTDGEIKILSNSGVFDGLTINGTKIAFTTSYTNSGTARAEYDIQVNRRVHLVGVHTSDRNALFVDGNLVSEVEISEGQKVDTYASIGGNLYAGTTASQDAIALNGVGIYAHALSTSSVLRHFQAGNSHIPRDAIPSQYGGTRIALSQNEADVFLEQTWTTEFDWTSASLTNVIVDNDKLKPRLESGVSVTGTWVDVFPMSASGATSVYGVNILWDGEGAIIEASLDGTTWETAVRGKNLTIIPPGFNTTNQDLAVRISFAGGVTDDPSFVDNLTVTGFETGVSPTAAGRNVTIAMPAYARKDYEPAEINDNWGTEVSTGGTVTIGSDTTTDPSNPRTIEVWFKQLPGATLTRNFTATVGFFHNGVTWAAGPQVGEWSVIHLVNTAPVVGDLVLGGDVLIGQVVLYEEAKTSAQVSEIYKAYVGIPKTAVFDSSAVSVTEPAEAAAIYDYDWSISSSG